MLFQLMRYYTARNKGRGTKEECRSKKGPIKVLYVRLYGDHEWWIHECSKHWVETKDAFFYIIIIIIIIESEPESRHTFPIDLSTLARFSAQKNPLMFNPLNPELNLICYLLALLAHHFLHVSRIRIKSLTLRLLMSYIYGAPILDVSRSHTTTHHSR